MHKASQKGKWRRQQTRGRRYGDGDSFVLDKFELGWF